MTFRSVPQRDIVILSSILIVASLLRFIGLDAPLWYDEIVTVLESIRMPLDVVTTEFSMNNHVFYSLQTKFFVAIFGEHNWVVRLPAALFGIAGVAAIWWLSYMLIGPWQAHVAAGLMAISYHHVWFSQNARGYTELLFWNVLSVILFLQALKDNRWRSWIVFGLSLFAALYTHVTAGFFIASLGLVYLAMVALTHFDSGVIPEHWKASKSAKYQWRGICGFALGGLLALAFYLPSLLELLEVVFTVSDTSAVDSMTEYQNPIWTFLESLRSLALGGFAGLAFGLLALFLIVVGGLGIGRKHPAVSAVVFLHVPITIILLLSVSMRVWPRFFFVDLGFFLVFITHGVFLCTKFAEGLVRRLFSFNFRQSHLFVLASVLMVVLSLGLLARNYQYPKQDFAGAMEMVEENRLPGDGVVVFGVSYFPFTAYYDANWTIIDTADELQSLLARGIRIWAVFGFPDRTSRDYAGILEIIDKDFSLAKRFPGTLGDGSVLVFVSKE